MSELDRNVIVVNKAMIRPILIAGVEKRLMFLNVLLAFPLVAATHFRFPACLLGVALFVVLHMIAVMITKHDPQIGLLFKRSTRYSQQMYYPAKSHPLALNVRPVKSISRPW